MLDIVILAPNHFQEWLQHFQINPAIQAKYQALFKEFDCFSKMHVNTYSGHASTSASASSSHRGGHRPPLQRPERQPKDYKKQLMACLNKVNQRNYDKMVSKIRILINAENLPACVEMLVNTASVQQLYIPFLARLLCDLHKVSGFGREIQKQLTTLYETHLNNEAFLFKEELGPTTGPMDYDLFCRLQKHKLRTINQTLFWLQFWRAPPHIVPFHAPMEDYIHCMKSHLPQYMDKENEPLLDMFLQVFQAIAASFPGQPLLHNIPWQSYADATESYKIKFAVEKIIQTLVQGKGADVLKA